MMTKTIQRRIDKLAARIPIGCQTCRSWTDTALIDDDGNRSQPESCPTCGRRVTVTLVHVIGVPLDCI